MNTISIIIAIIITICPFVTSGGIYTCYTDVIQGCTCTSVWVAADYRYKTTMTCNGNVGTAANFAKNLNKAQGYEFDDFILSGYPNVRLPDAPFDATSGTVIKRIIIRDSPNLQAFGSGPEKGFFQNLGINLETIVFSNNQNIRSTEWATIATQLPPSPNLALKNIEVISCKEFKTLESFKGFAPNLVTLILRGTGLANVNADLSLYAKLELLDLSETPGLTKFELPVALPPKLMNIFLNGCSLDTFSIDTMKFLTTPTAPTKYVALARDHLNCECANLPAGFVNDDNIKRFQGAVCETPVAAKGKPYASTCIGS